MSGGRRTRSQDFPALKLLKDAAYANGLMDVANDEREKHRYLEFHSRNENRLVKLLFINKNTLRDAETGEETKFTNENDDDDDDDGDEEEYYGRIVVSPDDISRLAEKHGRTADEFNELQYLANKTPSNEDVKEGLVPLDELLAKHEAKEVKELFVSDEVVDPGLKERLLKNVEQLKNSKPPDWHPGSNDMVNDIIHPTLYPFVRETAPEPDDAHVSHGDGRDDENGVFDRWGRKYRSSKYQWLPTDFVIDERGNAKVKEDSYINNLPPSDHDDLKENIEELVTLCIPPFEHVLQYANTTKFTADDPSDTMDESYPDLKKENLAGKTIQVVTKIAEYEFRNRGDTYEGVWHFEGLSHEHIVATAVYFLQVDERLEGGELHFKRAFTDVERGMVYSGVRQDPLTIIFNVTSELIPLGKIQTRENLLLMFPNSHAHKLAPISNPTDETLRRKIVALFFIDPKTPIRSTTGLKRPQETMTFERAKEIRLEMMAERKAAKEDLNSKEIEFCEH